MGGGASNFSYVDRYNTGVDHGPLTAEEFGAAVTAVTSAFGDPTRREIYLFAHGYDGGVTAAQVAERFELHPNVARHHLDKLAAGGYLDVAVERLYAIGAGREIGDALLDQRIAAGIGNAIKSETMWVQRVDPFALVDDLERDVAERLFVTAAKFLRAGTVDSRPVVVYDHEREPCPRCGTPIKRQRQGEHARSTYWCPTCQPQRS